MTYAKHQAVYSYRSGTPVVSTVTATPFPIGVDPIAKRITEQPNIDQFVSEYIASNHSPRNSGTGWLAQLSARLSLQTWYQSLASAASRLLVIQSGERREQVVANLSTILGWSVADQAYFIERMNTVLPGTTDGIFYPGRYTVEVGAGPEQVAELVAQTFYTEVAARYPEAVADTLPLHDVLVIASLIEREAYDFNDMRYISGVIWNRLFIDMRLQIDATLQYAKADVYGGPWWSVPRPADKFIDSPFNTYQIPGLPPTPIANPSIDAIVAALNPRATDCLFYFHDAQSGFHCTPTYEEHVTLLRQYYGQGS